MKQKKAKVPIFILGFLILLLLFVMFAGYSIHLPAPRVDFDIVFTTHEIDRHIINHDYVTKEITTIECPCGLCNIRGASSNNTWLYIICYGPERVSSWSHFGVLKDFGSCNISSELAPVNQTNDFIWATNLKERDRTSPIVLKQSSFFRNEILYIVEDGNHPFLGTNVRYKDTLYFALLNQDTGMYQLISYDLVSKIETTLFTDTNILKPAISLNGEMIVYSSTDGIYIFHLDSMKIEKIIDAEDFDGTKLQASWSGTSEKIVYDYCVSEEEYPCSQKNIYVYDLITKQSELIYMGGEEPYWVGN